MRAVIQRVTRARVSVGGEEISQIGVGLLILLGVEHLDDEDDVAWLVSKIANLRIFNDDQGVMNRSLLEIGGDAMVVSQFTLHARTKKGNRPSYIDAAPPHVSVPVYERFLGALSSELGRGVAAGRFGADMQVELLNDGPVTILIDTKNKQ